MSLSTRGYSKESCSSSYYSRSSSYHRNGNNSYSSSYRHHTINDDRPLSTRLIERDFSYPSLVWDWYFDDPFFFDRMHWRFDNDFFKYKFGLGRNIPIRYRGWNELSSRTIPIKYISSPKKRRDRLYNEADNNNNSTSSLSKRYDESSMIRENRISSEDWPPKQEPPTRKRSSMTIFIQQPYINQSEVPYYRHTPLTPTYPQSVRTNYY